MTDISNRADIDKLIEAFYAKIMKDSEIGHFFTEVVQLDLSHHLPKIADFWETAIFNTAKYKGNPLIPHINLNAKSPMTKVHFDQWVKVFCETIDNFFQGNRAELAKQRAHSIATVMLIKISQ